MRPPSVEPPQGFLGVSFWEGNKLLACSFQALDAALPAAGDSYYQQGLPAVVVKARHWTRTEEGRLMVDLECERVSERSPECTCGRQPHTRGCAAEGRTAPLPEGWQHVRDSQGVVLVSPEARGNELRVRWWGEHHDGLYVEGPDWAGVVPRAVLEAVLSTVGMRLAAVGVEEASKHAPHPGGARQPVVATTGDFGEVLTAAVKERFGQ